MATEARGENPARDPDLGVRSAVGPSGFSVTSAVVVATVVALALLLTLVPFESARAGTLPAGFRESVVFSGLKNPTAVEFAKDGRVFVAEKSGVIKVFDGLSDATPTVFADLGTEVHDFWDRGLLGLALDPSFPEKPYVYALYTHNAPIGGTAPRWPDSCPTPPGATGDGCVVSGRLSRLQASGDTMVGEERVLIEGWCQQYPSHTVGDLAFGSDGALYVSAGDGAGFHLTDWGQDGDPPNPCGDPPSGVGGVQKPPTAEGGALRSQDLRTAGDPVGLNGTILRVDPDTGDALPGNPLYGRADPNARRVVAYGLRNPFRFAVRPGTDEVWAGDVGWNSWEEIDRVRDATGQTAANFGWPCFEGTGRQGNYDNAGLDVCENLYGAPAGAVTAPFYAYGHSTAALDDPAGRCESTSGASRIGSSLAGVAFYGGGGYPDEYDGGLFFADYSRRCIWVMKTGPDGVPDPATRQTLVAGAAGPVNLQIGPGGDLFYVNLGGGEIRRIRYFGGNQPPTAVATADPTNGPAPLTVGFDGGGSSDPDPGDTLAYAWDLDGDGAYDDSTSQSPARTYGEPGLRTARLKVTDSLGAVGTDSVTIDVNNTPPEVAVESPLATTTWKVGDGISFSGSASDPQQGTLPASALSWSLILHHCAPGGSCHEHPLEDFDGVASGSFVTPDHEYPSHLELRLTATDAGGLTDTESLRLDPRTVTLSFASEPSGLRLGIGGDGATTPFDRTVIVGSKSSVSAPETQVLDGTSYVFRSWSNGGGRTQDAVAGGEPTTYTALYEPNPDTTKPGITGMRPRPGATVRDRTPAIRATVRDEVTDLSASQIRLYVDGRAVERFLYNRDTDGLVHLLDRKLPHGRHSVRVVATDGAGNEATRSWRFRVSGRTG